MAVEITVRGEAEARYAPERAIVSVAAALESGNKQKSYDDAVALQNAVTAQLTELADRDAVSTWSSDQVSVYTYRPWVDGNKRADPVHAARVNVTAEFVDFERLGGFLDYWAGRDGVEIAGVIWDVSERNRRGYEAEVRKAAVENALSKAQAYADALRRGRVVPTRIADAGLLDSGPAPYARTFEAVAMSDAGDAGVHLTPEPVVIHVAVDAGFVTD